MSKSCVSPPLLWHTWLNTKPPSEQIITVLGLWDAQRLWPSNCRLATSDRRLTFIVSMGLYDTLSYFSLNADDLGVGWHPLQSLATRNNNFLVILWNIFILCSTRKLVVARCYPWYTQRLLKIVKSRQFSNMFQNQRLATKIDENH